MGKKLQGAKLRALKRAKVALDELQEQQAEEGVASTLRNSGGAQQATNGNNTDDLFVVDRLGEVVPHHKRPPSSSKAMDASGQKKRKCMVLLSETDQEKVDALISLHGPDKVQAMAAKGRTKVLDASQSRRLTRSHTAWCQTKTNFDLWDATESDVQKQQPKFTAKGIQQVQQRSPTTTTTKSAQTISGIGSTVAGTAPAHVVVKAIQKTNKKPLPAKQSAVAKASSNIKTTAAVTVQVAAGGQSYHPDPVQHRAVLETATAVELAREAAIQFRDTPISQGMSAETKALLLGDDDDDDDETSLQNPSVAGVGLKNAGAIPKRANKLTKAQRNKQKRLRAEQAIQRQAKTTKKLLNQISEVPRYKKEIHRESQSAVQKKQEMAKLLEEKATLQQNGQDVEVRASRHDPVNAPTLPVALPTDLVRSAVSSCIGGNGTTISTRGASLRSIKPKGSLVTDRILSLAARGQIPAHSHTPAAVARRKKSQSRRKLSVKGKHNRDTQGETFKLLG